MRARRTNKRKEQMTKASMQPQWRYRRNALNKKGLLDVELLLENETVIIGKKRHEPEVQPMSPTSIFSTPEKMPEMKPIVLPGSWTVVGKRGKPIAQNDKMYDEPIKKKAKKKRSRARKDTTPDISWALECAPESSKCLQQLAASTSRKDKEAARGRLARHWGQYRQGKVAKAHAHNSLLASMMMLDEEVDAPEGRCGTERTPLPPPMTVRNHKKNSAREQARRRARDAKCWSYWDEEAAETEPEHVPMYSAPAPCMKPTIPAGSWELVGKRGKTISFTSPPTKKRVRTRKEGKPEALLHLEASPMASKCLQDVYQDAIHHQKVAMRGRTAKYWQRYRQARAIQIYARDMLLASPVFNEANEEATAMPAPTTRMHVRNHKKEKIRRRARDAKLALRTYSPHDNNDFDAVRLAEKKATPTIAFAYDFGVPSPTSPVASSPGVLVNVADVDGENAERHADRKRAKKSECVIS